MNKKFKKYRI